AVQVVLDGLALSPNPIAPLALLVRRNAKVGDEFSPHDHLLWYTLTNVSMSQTAPMSISDRFQGVNFGYQWQGKAAGYASIYRHLAVGPLRSWEGIALGCRPSRDVTRSYGRKLVTA